MRVDLHSHSTASDGTLSPTELVERALSREVDVLALTDHDSVDGLLEAKQKAETSSLNFIAGIELSVTWEKRTLHIVGLNIDSSSQLLLDGIAQLKEKRAARTKRIAQKLIRAGAGEAVELAFEAATPEKLTRTHFARSLVACGFGKHMGDAFNRYLSKGKSAYVRGEWASLEQSCEWINQSGGLAVIAHPHRYKLTRSWARKMLGSFKNNGGSAVEVVCGSSTDDRVRYWARQAADHGLMASVGSDFHSTENSWIDLGRLRSLPHFSEPVWHQWPQLLQKSG
ncbi:MAG: PHP domain-containing protein [bacterium]